jgi:hypothetical protein
MSKKRPVGRLIPAALVVSSLGCTGDPPCGSVAGDVCRPDGGHWCEDVRNPRDCFHTGPDGGIDRDSTGDPICFC